MEKMKKIIYPGTFDPITNGHLDIADKASKLFDELIFVVANNPDKNPLFNVEERMEMIRRSTTHLSNTCVESTSILTVDFAKENTALAIIRGLRHVSDFEYEFQLSGMNKRLNSEIETLFMTPSEEFANISSSLVREILSLGGDISPFVPAQVKTILLDTLQK